MKRLILLAVALTILLTCASAFADKLCCCKSCTPNGSCTPPHCGTCPCSAAQEASAIQRLDLRDPITQSINRYDRRQSRQEGQIQQLSLKPTTNEGETPEACVIADPK